MLQVAHNICILCIEYIERDRQVDIEAVITVEMLQCYI
jgi:hypothetical protein